MHLVEHFSLAASANTLTSLVMAFVLGTAIGLERQYRQRTAVEAELERSSYPIRDLDVRAFGEAEIEIEATLAATSVDGDELDAVVRRIAARPGVRQAFWAPSTTE
ncbi:MgtC/SapB family protein [Silanimonas lenta]|uniref:MgtC/SapB family protein n=1 Tax=Silanimonas lenta TaxID=265429 RepID=UPI000426944E|nr:MgtC/SapB family protein [Silanimonas lenta]